MKYSLIADLIVITNSLIYKELTLEESTSVEELNDALIKAKKIYDQHRDKLIKEYGGVLNSEGHYEGITEKTELANKLTQSLDMDIDFKKNTQILSLSSIIQQTRVVPFNGIQVRMMKERLLRPEKEHTKLLSDKYPNKQKIAK